MYPIAEHIQNIFASGASQKARITVVQKDGSTYVLTDADICESGLSVDRYSVTGQVMELGSAVASELSLTLRNDGALNDKQFQGAEMFVEVGVVDSVTPRMLTLENGLQLQTESEQTIEMEIYNDLPSDTETTVVYIPLGWFKVDSPPRKLSTISISALDRMIRFDKDVEKADLSFPCTVSALLLAICNACNVQLADASVASLTNADYEIQSFPEQENLTYRTLLMWIAQITGTCAYMDWNGHLRLDWYETESPAISIDESARYDSDLQEQTITITGVEIHTNDDTVLQSAVFQEDYVISVEGNLLLQGNEQAVADALGNKIVGFQYIPFTAQTLSMPHLLPMDCVDFVKNGTVHKTVVTNVNYALNGSTSLAAKGETEELRKLPSLSPFTPEQTKINQKRDEHIEQSLTAQESATLHLNQTAASAMGMYYKEVTDENGGVVRYWHDNESLENSLYICMQNSGGSFSTNTGWNHGNPQWTAGTDKFGNAVVSLLNTIGIQAEWIQADSITTDKLSIGQSERGTNLIEDSSFEHGGVFYRAAYSDDTEDAVIVSPAHNDCWNAVNFDSSETYGAQYRGWLEVPSVGGFDGNKAILDVNHKGLVEDAKEWFTGYEQIQPIPIEMLTHTVSFYYRVHRYPIGTPQGTETAHAKYAFKIQWLDGNGAEISCTFQSFSVQSDGTETWNRLYAAVNPPNGTVSAKFAIGFVCTDLAIFVDGDETDYPNMEIWNDVETDAVGGYPDLAFLDLDGILFETGTSLNTWTCSESELQNTGVIINSNGINIADGKISVTDIYGRKVLYTDGNNNLQLVGGLTAQMHDKTDNRVCAQMQIASSNERNPYADSSGTFYNSFLGQTFTRFDKDGTAEKVGHIGMTFTQDENVSNDRPMEFYSENGFWFNGKGFWFNRTRPLICDPVEIDEDIGYLAYVISPGWYTVSTDAKAAKIRQTPVPRAFFMQVFRFGNYVTQYFVSRIGETYQRTFDYASPDGVSGYNWTHVTGTYTQSLKETLHIASISDIPPGKYTVEAEDIILVQHLNDERNYEDIFPVKKKGVLESFNGTDGNTYQRYTTWDGFVYTRHSYPGSWTWWWCNGVRADN